MRITDLLSASSIDLNAKPLNKKEAIEQAVKLMAASGNITDIEAYTKQVIAREEESTTGVGEGIAIPHGKCSAVSRPGLAAMIIRDGVDYDSLDGEPVNVLFLIAAPDSEDNVHLDVLSKLSVLLMDEEFIRKLKAAKDIGEFLEVIDNADSESKSIDERLQDTGTYNAGNSDTNPADRYIVAVTSCPTGIAHTYMAAEGLEKAAKKAGCTIKIETRGSAGAKNVLTDEDIEKAVKDAEAHAAEDKKMKEDIEVRNNAESLIFNTEKTMKDIGDKISNEEKSKVEAELENLKKTLEGKDTEAIKNATEKLTSVFYEITEKLYKNANPNGAAAGANADAGTNGTAEGPKTDENGNVYDADYKVEDDNDKK